MTKKEHIALIVAGVSILLTYAVVGFFAHPSGDDFTYAVLGAKGDFLDTVLYERQRWNGRYLSNFLVIGSPLNWGGIAAYQWMPLLLIGFIFTGTAVVFKNIVGSQHVLLSLVCTTITFSIMPDITEGIYWYTGAWTYIPGGVLLLLGLSICHRFWGRFSLGHYALVTILFVIASGFNEIIPLLGIKVFASLQIQKRKLDGATFLLLLFILVLGYMLMAPGNAARSGHFSEKNQLLQSLLMSGAYTVRFIGEWMLNPAIVLWGIVLLSFDVESEKVAQLRYLRKPLVIFFALFVPTYLCCFGPIWSTGILGQYRTPNLASYLFLPSFTLVILANKEFLSSKIKLKKLSRYAVVLLTVFLFLWKNQLILYKEIATGEIVQFDREMDNRYALIEACEAPVCEIPEIEAQSKTLFVYPLVDDPGHWMNESYQLYFKSGEIHRQKPAVAD